MATLSTAAKNAALQAIKDTAGSPISGTFKPAVGIQLTVAKQVALGTPSGGSVALLGTPMTFSHSTGHVGTCAKFDLFNVTETVISCSVGGPDSGEDIEMSPSTEITAGLSVRLNSLTLSIA